jgi:hypothetical protein
MNPSVVISFDESGVWFTVQAKAADDDEFRPLLMIPMTANAARIIANDLVKAADEFATLPGLIAEVDDAMGGGG